MFCPNCGKEIPAGRFCTYCGAQIPADGPRIEKEDNISINLGGSLKSADNGVTQSETLQGGNTPQYSAIKKPHSKTPIVVGGIAIVLLAFVIIIVFSGRNSKREIAIETVRNGYLGCYTDITVDEFVTYFLEMSGDSQPIKWDGGTTDDGDYIVEASSTYETLDGEEQRIRVQFKMLSENTFAFNGVDDGITDMTKVADILETLNYTYFMYYWLQLGMDVEEAVAKLDTCSYGAVLCGASASYTGDREYLYPEEFELDPIPVTAADYLDLWGYIDDSEGETSPSDYNTVSPDIEAAYRPIIGSYSIGLRDHYDMSMFESYGLNYMGIYYDFEDIGYVMQDITGDGIPELIIGEISGNPGFFLDMYTVMDGEAALLVRSGERDRYYLCKNGYLENQWSAGAADSGVDYYQIVWERANDQLYIDFDLVESGEYERYDYVTFNFQPLPAI